MEHVVTSGARPAASAITDVANSAGEAPSLTGKTDKEVQWQRQRRMAKLREAIENGDYFVSAPDLADALLRAARVAN